MRSIFSDYFFESMILLKHSFCWDWIDVLYFVTNQRANRKECSTLHTVCNTRFDSRSINHANHVVCELDKGIERRLDPKNNQLEQYRSENL